MVIKKRIQIKIYKKNFTDKKPTFKYYNESDGWDLVPFSIRNIKYTKKFYINKDSILTIDDYLQQYRISIRNNIIKSDYFLYPKKDLKIVKAKIHKNFVTDLKQNAFLEFLEIECLIIKDYNFKFFKDQTLIIPDENLNDYIIILKYNDIFIRYSLYLIENKKLLENNIEDMNMTYIEIMYLYLKKNDWYNEYTELIRFYNISSFLRLNIIN
jgi:hypothetical protein